MKYLIVTVSDYKGGEIGITAIEDYNKLKNKYEQDL